MGLIGRARTGLLLLALLTGLTLWQVSAQPAAGEAVAVVYAERAISGEFRGDLDVGAQLLSLDGQMLWGEGEHSLPVADSKRLEGNPAAVSDGAGGWIVAFEVSFPGPDQEGDVDIYAQRVSPAGQLLWGDRQNPVSVAASAWRERNPTIVCDGQGGAIVIFEEHGPPDTEHAGDIDVGAQRISPEGKLLWFEEEKSAIVASSTLLERAPAAVADGRGGVIVVFEVEATSGEEAGDVDLGAQHLDASGQMLWNEGERSEMVAASKWGERRPVVVADGAGGAIVAFEEHAPPGSEFGDDVDVASQRVTSDGQTLWGEDGSLSVSEADDFLERAPALLSDGSGGAWIVFEGEARKGEHAGDSEVLVQRVSAAGSLRWSDGAKGVASSKWSERAPVVVGDGGGGVIAVFEEHAPTGHEHAGDVDVAAQRLSPEGERLWNQGTKSATVSNSRSLERQPWALADGAGGVVIVFELRSRDPAEAQESDVYAQRLDASGRMLWNEGKRPSTVAASDWDETGPRLPAGE